MARFRTNHQRGSGGRGGNPFRTTISVVIFAVVLILFVFFAQRLGVLEKLFAPSEVPQLAPDDRFYLPENSSGTIYHQKYYSLSWSERHEVAEWVAYVLERDRLNMPYVKRTDNFRADLDIATRSSDPNDYRRSGYDRGHLVAAADMAFSTEAMSATFLMSNISPQVRAFNGGVWRELEEQTRYWAKRFKRLYVVTGPLLTEQPIAYIGRNKVSVPAAFYKVLLDVDDPEKKGIAFLIPNEMSVSPLEDYMISIDSLEILTGLDFYGQLMQEDLEAELEASFDPALWPTSAKKYRLRVENWNKR